MDVGGMSGTHVRRSSIAEQDVIVAKPDESTLIAVKRASHGLLSNLSTGRGG